MFQEAPLYSPILEIIPALVSDEGSHRLWVSCLGLNFGLTVQTPFSFKMRMYRVVEAVYKPRREWSLRQIAWI